MGEMHEVLTFNPVGANSDIADPNDDMDELHVNESSEENFAERFLAVIGRFYMMLQGKLLIPASTIQTIVEEMSIIHDMGQEHLINILGNSLTANGMNEEQSVAICKEVCSQDAFNIHLCFYRKCLCTLLPVLFL